MQQRTPIDYGPLIKRNFIFLLEKYNTLSKSDTEMRCRAIEYERVLLQLPNHPILDIDDVRHIQTTSVIMQQIGELIRSETDLAEVTAYIRSVDTP